MHEHSLISELEKSFAEFTTSLSGVRKAYGQISSKLDAFQSRESISRDYLKEMAGNLAHEIRNPLGGIATLVELLSDENGQHSDNIRGILEGVQRIDKIVENLVVFSRPLTVHKIKCNFPDVLRKTVRAFESQLPETEPRACLVLHLPDTDVFVEIDVALMQQAVMNVLRNAVENMPAGGKVEIEMQPSETNLVALTIRDRGPGIPEADLHKAFYPFYTTKTYGMGLGLPTSKLIVEKHGGTISLQQNNGPGTCVRIELPASQGEALS